MSLSSGQAKVLKYLIDHYPKWSTPTSIGEEINGKGAGWAAPLLAKLHQMGVVEKDPMGRFRAGSLQLPIDPRLP